MKRDGWKMNPAVCSQRGRRAVSPPPPSASGQRVVVWFTPISARIARRQRRLVGIVVLSQHADPIYALELLMDGTDGYAYLLKDKWATSSSWCAR